MFRVAETLAWLLCWWLIGAEGAVQSTSPEVGTGGLQSGHLYHYNYSSIAQLYEDNNISIQARVSLQLLSDSGNEISLTVSNLSLTWVTSHGAVSNANPIGNLSNWFSLVRDETSGGVAHVFYPRDESKAVLAFKKSLSQLISVGEVVERSIGEGGVHLVRERGFRGRDVFVDKVLRYDSNGVLMAVQSNELLQYGGLDESSSSFAVLAFPLSSQSVLTLVDRHVALDRQRPQAVVMDIVDINEVQETLSLSDILPLVTHTLRSCPIAECSHRLGGILRQLNPADIGSLLNELEVPTDRKILLINALVANGMNSRALIGLLSAEEDENIVEKVLIYLATGQISPNQMSVEATLRLLPTPLGTGVGVVSPHLQHVALLSLGGMAKILTQQHNIQLANQIMDVLSLALDHVTDSSSSTSRLRRSVDGDEATSQLSLLHAVVLDSIGNSMAPRFLPHLVDHVTTDHGSLALKHAAVKAIGRYQSNESAEILFQTAESSPHPSVSHLAAVAYSTHPHRKRDVSHLLSSSPHHRSRRQVENPELAVLNISMPTVNWNREFGDANISVDLTRTVRNSYDIDTDTISSRYTFSLYDETTFDANLLLSQGEEHAKMWGTEICLQGTATYDINILNDFSHNITTHHYNRLQSAASQISQDFANAYNLITNSETAYLSATSQLQTAINDVPSRYNRVLDSLDNYRRGAITVGASDLKERADELYRQLNETFSMGYAPVLSSLSAISDALNELYPARPLALISSLQVDGLPFTESRFLVRYIAAAPQQAMAGIFNVYRSSAAAFDALSSSYNSLQQLVDPYGINSFWLSPLSYLREAQTRVSVLEAAIQSSIDAKDLLQLSDTEVEDLRSLLSVVTSHLKVTIDLADEVGEALIAAGQGIERAFSGSRAGFDAFTLAFENSRQQIDAIFGQKFHPNFPRQFKSCDSSGCGRYPSTSGGVFNAGIDVQVDSTNNIPSPLSSYVKLFNSSLLPASIQHQYFIPNYSNSLILIPAESSYTGVYIILSNLVPVSNIGTELRFFTAGDLVGNGNSDSLHIEIIKVIDGVGYRLDPTSFLQPRLEPNVGVELECNDVVTYLGGVVVDRQNLVQSSNPITHELLGNPLVIDVPNHEFPQPFDLTVREDDILTPAASSMTFLQSSTFLMVGQIPVEFDFSIVGTYQLNYSLNAGLLSLTLDLPITPSFLARAQGSVRVGSTVYATVNLRGTMLETSLPLSLRQEAVSWPMVASSTMDIILIPSTLNLTSELTQLTTGSDDGSNQELLQSHTHWSYSIPPLHRDEFYYQGLLTDDTPPLYTPLMFTADQSNCYVRQLPTRHYNNPAFEILFDVTDPESSLNVTLGVGTYINSDDIIPFIEIAGQSLTVYHSLLPATQLLFTVIATNNNGLRSFASCSLPNNHFYDRSPPLARVNPIGQVSSHPSKIQALVVLFDEFGFEEIVQEIAIGRVPGEAGSNALQWTPLNVTLINIQPIGVESVMELYSFGRSGRLITGIIEAVSNIENVSNCAYLCENLPECRSFDYSSPVANCILHDSIEGPSSSQFENIYSTPPLQQAETYNHYERLGVGNSTIVEFSGLSLEHDTMYYFNLRLRNGLGYENIVSSGQFLVDLTPPLPGLIRPSNTSLESVFPDGCTMADVPIQGCIDGVVPRVADMLYTDGLGSAVLFNGHVPLTDARFTSATNYLSANWNPFLDPESGIFGYTWCIGTSIGSCDIQDHIDPHTQLGITSPEAWTYSGIASGLQLSEAAYYITLRATNKIAYGGPLFTTVQHSTPYIVDVTPPVVDSAVDVEYNSSTNQILVVYRASDEGGQLERVELALGRSQLDTDVLRWTVLINQSDSEDGMAVINAEIPDGLPVWLKLRATDEAGLQSILVAENSFTVDRTPPVAGEVYDGPNPRTDSEYQQQTDTICVNWDGFSDPHSGIEEIQWSISRMVGGTPVSSRNLTSTEMRVGVACMNGLFLTHNTTYYSTLTFYNGAVEKMAVTVTSTGVRIDTSSPLPGVIYDGPYPNIDHLFSNSFTTVQVNWNGFIDYESGIAAYTINIFHHPLDSSVPELIYSESIGGMERDLTRNQFQFKDGDFVIVELVAWNGAGGNTRVNSTGVIIDLTPPSLTRIVDGNSTMNDLQYQLSNSSLAVSWLVNDMESAIEGILGNVYQLSEGRRIKIYPSVGDRGEVIPNDHTTWVVEGLSLISGYRYACSVTFINGAGLEVTHETDGVIVDATPPTVMSVRVLSDSYVDASNTLDAITIVTDPNQTESRWLAFDAESGILEYLVGVVDSNGTLVTAGYSVFDGGVIGGLILTPNLPLGELYRIAIRATNNAGMQSELTFSDPYRVVTGGNAGTVLDGGGPTDSDFTDEITVVTASFHSFSSQSCGGIVRYEWAVGVSAEGIERESLIQFTSKGIFDDGDGSGHAQLPVAGLKDVNHRLYTTVRGITGCGNILESTSNGFIIDTSPPSLEVIGTGSQAIERAQYSTNTHESYQSVDLYSSIWSAHDLQSGVPGDVMVKIGTFPGGSDISSNITVPDDYIRTRITTREEGTPTYVTVTATNGARVESTAISEPITLDTSPPFIGEINCNGWGYPMPLPQWGVDRSPFVSNNTGHIVCHWDGIMDPESGIQQYAIAIGTSQTDQSVMSRTILEGTCLNDFISPVFHIVSPTVPYYVTLFSTNGVNQEAITISNPIYFDISPPIISGGVFIRPNFKVADYIMGVLTNLSSGAESAVCLLDTDIVSILFDAPQDTESGSVFNFELGVGYFPGNDDVLRFEVINPVPLPSNGEIVTTLYHRLTPISFTAVGRRGIYFTIRVLNRAHLVTVLTSNVVFIKSGLTLEWNWIYDGTEFGSDIDYQISTIEMGAIFHLGVNCPIREGRWAVESVDGNLTQPYVYLDINQFQNPIENTFHVFSDQLLLFNDETYRILVQVTDYTGEVHILRSNGTSVTTQGLIPGIVRDGPIPEQDLNYQESVTTLWACWNEFGNGLPEQKIAYYEVAAGSNLEFPSTRTNIAPFTMVGLNTTHTFGGLNLVPELVTYFITVRAYAVSGAYVESHSNGIIAGLGHSILPGHITIPRFQADSETLKAHWSDFQSSLPIRQYEWALGTRFFNSSQLEEFCSNTTSSFEDWFEVSGFRNVEVDTIVSITDLDLQHNITYYLSLRVIDQAKKCITTTTPRGVTIDQTPPTIINSSPLSVTLGPVQSQRLNSDFVIYVPPDSSFTVEWEPFHDGESGIDFYEVGIFPQSVCGENENVTGIVVSIGVVNVGTDLQAHLTGVTLESNQSYVAVVMATNLAGVTGRAYSQPILLDDLVPIPGSVKDGPEWDTDLVYQSDLSMLKAVFAHAKLPPTTPGVTTNSPCPNTTSFELSNLDPEWDTLSSPDLIGYAAATVMYNEEQVSVSTYPQGIQITAERDRITSILTSGVYQTHVDLSRGGTFQVDILAAAGHPGFEMNSVTSVLFIDTGPLSNTVAKFEPGVPDFDFGDSPIFSGFGIQIYKEFSNRTTTLPQRIVMWARDGTLLGQPLFVNREIPSIDLLFPNTYRIEFQNEQQDTDYSRTAQLYINGVLMASLEGLPALSNYTRVVFNVFNLLGYLPPLDTTNNPLSVAAVFANVTIPSYLDHLCDYGIPFYSSQSPIVEFLAGVGTKPGLTDIEELKTVSLPCLPCLPGPCQLYSCNSSICTLTDPYTIDVTFTNLTLTPGYLAPSNQSLIPSAHNLLGISDSYWFQPATYYITVEAVTASGNRVLSSSNGVTIDTSPPVLVSPIQHFDVSFSDADPVRFQGNNSTISARWTFHDEQSFVTEYMWAIGTVPFGTDTQPFTSVGLEGGATTTNLVLMHNTTYYVSVVARNGAGLVNNVTSDGITYIQTELNETLLNRIVDVGFTRIQTFGNETVREIDRDFYASVRWEGVGGDIEDISWFIGSVPGAADILPPVEISLFQLNNPSATIDRGVLYRGNQVLTNVSEIIALAEGKEENPEDNYFFFEPGRLLYHSIEFCNFVHVCTIGAGTPGIVIRSKDFRFLARFADSAARLVANQDVGVGINRETLHALDKEYRLTLDTDRGLNQGSILYAGFLNQTDVQKTYRVNTPYISNPFLTMGFTSRSIARRFMEFGGPSFFVSFLGQTSLNAPLDINVTFDSSLDWNVAMPEIAYWDIDTGVWREVSDTCMNNSRVDYATYTLAVRVCSTLLGVSDMTTPYPDRPRQRRQADSMQNTTIGSGSGLMEDTTIVQPLSYLDRPVQFVVMRIGNVSTNTAPRLQLPPLPLVVIEDTVLSIQLEYTDNELDIVDFRLESVSLIGNVSLSASGQLTYVPCRHCTGMDMISLSIRERPIVENHTPLEDSGEIILQIRNVINDPPLLYFYDNDNMDEIIANTTITVYIDSNRTIPAALASVAAMDFDGYSDDLQLAVLQDGRYGRVGFQTILDAVGILESLPVSVPEGLNQRLSSYLDYLTFLSSYITYLPNDPSFTGQDTISIIVRDSVLLQNLDLPLVINIEVLPSVCENNGVCSGSVADPNCTDIASRRVNSSAYNCSCLPGFEGRFCEIILIVPQPVLTRDCPPGIPMVQCDGDPCEGAMCPSHPNAECRSNYCGSCKAEWYHQGNRVSCNADDISSVCNKLIPNPSNQVIIDCNGVECDCPSQPYTCPPDSVLIENRIDNCCVVYKCSCPNISCPLIMEGGLGVQPVPNYRGNQFPGRCCPEYNFENINECQIHSENLCSDLCIDEERTYTCNCPEGKTLAQDGINCGVCLHNGSEYLIGDRVKIGCNWCLCSSDELSSERWHCTANSCDRSCRSNGILYPLGSIVMAGSYQCVCQETDINSEEWICREF